MFAYETQRPLLETTGDSERDLKNLHSSRKVDKFEFIQFIIQIRFSNNSKNPVRPCEIGN